MVAYVPELRKLNPMPAMEKAKEELGLYHRSSKMHQNLLFQLPLKCSDEEAKKEDKINIW